MDRKLSTSEEIQRLTRLSEASRACLGREISTLKHRLDVPARLKDSLKSHPTGWLFGSLASGLAASLLFRRKRQAPVAAKKHRSLPVALLGLTLTAIRPFAKVWLADQVKNYLSGNSVFAPSPTQQRRHESSRHY